MKSTAMHELLNSENQDAEELEQGIIEFSARMKTKDLKGNITSNDLEVIAETLQVASDYYYNLGQFIMTDKLFDEILSMLQQYDGYENVNFGGKVPKNKKYSAHTVENLLGTLEKVNTLDELTSWIRTKSIELDVSEQTVIGNLVVSLKYDGNSLAFTFTKRQSKFLVSSVTTRGKNNEAVDLTKHFSGIVIKSNKLLENFDSFIVKVEACISTDEMENQNEVRKTKKKDPYKNRRAAIGGILNQDDLELYVPNISFVVLEVRSHINGVWEILEDYSHESLNLPANFEEKETYEFSKLKKLYKKLSDVEIRNEYPYMIDGLVLSLEKQEYKDLLGYKVGSANPSPKFAIALKFPHQKIQTTLIRVEYDIGSTGTLTPCAVIEPVILNGNTYSRVSLANIERMKSEDFRIGDTLEFSLRNEILGYVVRDLTGIIGKKKPEIPSHCPFCGEPVSYSASEVFLKCTNSECRGIVVEQINQFTSTMKMKGIEVSTISALYDVGLLRKIEDLYSLKNHKSKIVKMDGFGELSYQALMETVTSRDSGELFDYEILASVGIEGIGLTLAKEICKKFDIQEILEGDPTMIAMQMKNIDGFADIRIKNFLDGIDSKFDLLEFLFNDAYDSKYKPFVEEAKKFKVDSQSFTVVVTGELTGMSRPQFERMLQERGHKVVGSVSKKTNYLVTNDTASGTVKNAKAKELGIPILNQADFMKMLDSLI